MLFWCSVVNAVQIVTVTSESVRGSTQVGDIIAIHEDDVQLTGNGYAHVKVIRIKGYTKADLSKFLATPTETENSKYLYNLTTTTQDSIDLNSDETVKKSQILTSKLTKND